ncbi:MAG: hypothetical protein ACRDCA_12605 [Serratia sp. (in: enterobacteria)]
MLWDMLKSLDRLSWASIIIAFIFVVALIIDAFADDEVKNDK